MIIKFYAVRRLIMCFLRASKDSKLCDGTEKVNSTQHMCMLLKKVPMFHSTNDLHEKYI